MSEQPSLKVQDHGRRIGLVIAHPDDETLFFGPTLAAFRFSCCLTLRRRTPSFSYNSDARSRSLMRQSIQFDEDDNNLRRQVQSAETFHVLCLSTGNYGGLGETRRQELVDCLARVFGIHDVEIIDDEDRFQDHLYKEWQEDLVSHEVEKFVTKNNINLLFTFDEWGISNHPNHISCYKGVQHFINHSVSDANLDVYYLITVSLCRQFLGLFEALFTCIWTRCRHALLQLTFFPTLFGLQIHRSQARGRYPHVLFSRYSYFNQYRRAQREKRKDK